MKIVHIGSAFLALFNFARKHASLKIIPIVAVGILAIFFGDIELAYATAARDVGSDFLYNFNVGGVLLEQGSMNNSASPYWWVNSGGKMLIESGRGKTVQDELSSGDATRLIYATMNALDTDDGYHPQNTFRLLTRSTWNDAIQQVAFRITEQNYSDSPNRDGHNGVLLMSRYQDQYNLYYAGIRNDGLAVIKKKINGTYHTLATQQIFGVEGQYDRNSAPSLLPKNKWMRIKVYVYDLKNGDVRIRLFLDRENDGSFVSILKADDTGVGGAPHGNGYAGIRTDFMDVEFDNYRISDMY